MEICAFLKEHTDGSVKLSLRAKSYADVNAVAKALGGGGHVKAAGATINAPMEEALRLTKAAIVKELLKY